MKPLLLALAVVLVAGLPAGSARADGPARVQSSERSRAKPRAKPKPTISLDVYQADLPNVIRLLADVSGKNVVIPEGVQGKVSVKLTNVPWDAALETVLALHGLGMVERGNILRIAPKATLEAEARAALEEREAWRKSAPLVTRIIPVSYARAAELAPLIKDVLSERGKVTYDERTNVLIVRDVAGSPALGYAE